MRFSYSKKSTFSNFIFFPDNTEQNDFLNILVDNYGQKDLESEMALFMAAVS